MTVVELHSAPAARHTLLEDLLLGAAASAAALVEGRIARRSARIADPTGELSTEARRSALAGAHAHGLLPR